MNSHLAKHSPMHSTTGFAHPPRNVRAFNLEPGMVVADFGAGSGAYVMEMAEVVTSSGKVYAIDVQKDLLRRIHNEAVKRGHHHVNILWGDLEKSHGTKLSDELCDVVLISNLLFQVEDKKAVLREAKRILRPRGRLVIIDWEESFGGLGPIKSDVFNKEDALDLCESLAFKFIDEFSAGAHHYGIVFQANRT